MTGGANGILKVDPLSFFGHVIPVTKGAGVFNVAYLYVALAFFTVLFVALRFVDRSRTGRAWRSLREDPLAAQLMGMPVPWLKLMAFSFGAAIASLTGTLFVALNGAVFPGNFDLSLLVPDEAACVQRRLPLRRPGRSSSSSTSPCASSTSRGRGGVALAARGSTGSRGDGDAGQLAEAMSFAFGAAIAALSGTFVAP